MPQAAEQACELCEVRISRCGKVAFSASECVGAGPPNSRDGSRAPSIQLGGNHQGARSREAEPGSHSTPVSLLIPFLPESLHQHCSHWMTVSMVTLALRPYDPATGNKSLWGPYHTPDSTPGLFIAPTHL